LLYSLKENQHLEKIVNSKNIFNKELIMKKLLKVLPIFFFVLLLSVSTKAQETQSDVTLFSTMIPTRDGKELAADIFVPLTGSPHPTIFIYTPYNREVMSDIFPQLNLFTEFVDFENYAYVIVDWRGYYGSADAGPFSTEKLGEDGYDVVEWIAQQSWSNQKVGMCGASALGNAQFITAAQNPPHLVCISPHVIGAVDLYNRHYEGGVLKGQETEMKKYIGFSDHSRFIADHPSYDNYWKTYESDSMERLSDLNLPIFMVGGWFDLTPSIVLDTINQISSLSGPIAKNETKVLMGPWTHDTASIGHLTVGEVNFDKASFQSDKHIRRFFDYWLREEPNGWNQEPPIKYFQMGESVWKTSNVWPVEDLNANTFYLGEFFTLKLEPSVYQQETAYLYIPADPSPTCGGNVFTHPLAPPEYQIDGGPKDQRLKVESRNDYISFESPVLDSNVILTGQAKIKLFVSSDQIDTDFMVRLCDVYPDEKSMLITDSAQRMKFRNSLETPEFITPGDIYPITIALPATAHTFLPNHKIKIIISSSNYPRFVRNPNNGNDFLQEGESGLAALNTIYFGGVTPSCIELPFCEACPSTIIDVQLPLIDGFTPESVAIGDVVAILGNNFFVGDVEVKFNGTADPAEIFEHQSSKMILVYVPPGATTGPIIVTNSNGSSSSSTDFVVSPPTITGFTQSAHWGGQLDIQGNGFVDLTGVTIAGVSVDIDNPDNIWYVPNLITIKLPEGVFDGPVVVSTLRGTVQSEESFHLSGPGIESKTESGSWGDFVAIVGFGFIDIIDVKIGEVSTPIIEDSDLPPALEEFPNSHNLIYVRVPEGAVTGKIEVNSQRGTAISVTDFVINEPAIIGFTPASGGVGTLIGIDGRGFFGVNKVTIGGIEIPFAISSFSSSFISTGVPVGGVTTGKIVVSYSQGTMVESAGEFTFISVPIIDSIEPIIGVVGDNIIEIGSAGDTITINGSHFSGASLVTLHLYKYPNWDNENISVEFELVSDDHITFTIPEDTVLSTGYLSVETPDGTGYSQQIFLIR
jgi:predicted acyl esterase